MIRISHDKLEFAYIALNKKIVEGSDPNSCIEVLQDMYPNDSFILSVDTKTITHYGNGDTVSVLRRIRPA